MPKNAQIPAQKNKTDDPALIKFLKDLPPEIPDVLLFYQLKQGGKVDIRLDVSGKYSEDIPLRVELISQEGDLLIGPITVDSSDWTASFTISENIPEGTYILQVTYQNCVLDRTTFDLIWDQETVRQLEAFDQGLKAQDQVDQAIKSGDYPRAIKAQKDVVKHFLNVNQELAVNSWKNLANVFDEKNELTFRDQALQEAKILKQKIDIISCLASRIKSYREQNNLSQGDFAHEINIARREIQDWEEGRGFEELEKYISIAATLGCNLDDLIMYEKPYSKIEEYLKSKNMSLSDLAHTLNFSRQEMLSLAEGEELEKYVKLSQSLDLKIAEFIPIAVNS